MVKLETPAEILTFGDVHRLHGLHRRRQRRLATACLAPSVVYSSFQRRDATLTSTLQLLLLSQTNERREQNTERHERTNETQKPPIDLITMSRRTAGPMMPEHLLAKRKREEEEESSAAAKAPAATEEKKTRISGPAPPPAPLDERPPGSPPRASVDSDADADTSSDDDDFGPAPPKPNKSEVRKATLLPVTCPASSRLAPPSLLNLL
jgi:type IV secretory pathway VirB10-like protein